MACKEPDECQMVKAPSQVSCPPRGPGIITDTKRSSQLLNAASRCYKEGLFTDVTVVVDGVRFETHRLVLAGLSDYFPPLFKLDQTGSGDVTLHEITSEDFAILLEFAYTGDITLTKENVQGILMAADYLSVSFVRDACEVFMANNLDCENVCDALRFSCNLSFKHLLEQAKDFLTKNLNTIYKSPGFLELDPIFLFSFFDDDNLVLYQGVVMKSNDREKLILKSVLRYLSQTTPPSNEIFAQLIQAVRFPVLPKDVIKKKVKKCKLDNNEIVRKYLDKWDIATTCIDEVNKGSSFAEAIAVDACVPQSWLRPRKLAAYSISCSPHRYAAGGQVARSPHPPKPKFDDPNMEISKIEIWIRRWDGRPVIGCIKITYRNLGNDGKELEAMCGEINLSWEHHSIVLQPHEYIVSVAVGSGWLVDRLGFVTSFGRSFGPFGGQGGNDQVENSPEGAMAYLHDINCESTRTQGACAIFNLILRWITLE